MTNGRSRSTPRQDDARLLAAAVWAADVGAYEWDLRRDRVRWLNDWCRRYGLDPCEGAHHGRRWRARVHPDDRIASRHEYAEHLAGNRDRYESEYRIRTLDGSWRWIRNRGYVVRDRRGERLVGLCVDVDERKRTEAALEHSRRSLEALAAAAPIWMLLLDPLGNVEFLNRPMRQRGIEPEALRGRPVATVAADGDEARRIESLRQRVLRSGESQTLTLTLADGRAIEVFATPVREAGAITGIAAVALDVSERRDRERELLAAVTAEQRRFARDLHDGLGQELTGISLLARSLARPLAAAAPALLPGLEELVAATTAAIATSREVARGVSPVALGEGGLSGALRELAARNRRRGGPAVRCRLSDRAGRPCDALVADNLYRIAQEAIGNANRHAGAREVRLGFDRTARRLRLVVEDDGVGLAPGDEGRGGLGLRIMRARAELIGAQLVISAAPGQGTRVECLRPEGGAAGIRRAAAGAGTGWRGRRSA
ncbi:MAG: PAS domain-containing protein [Proteobacteria bacterium]|nr:PAS domain-containing protein [Pseudomonadota bacterium]